MAVTFGRKYLPTDQVISGDLLPALSQTKKGSCPATGTPSGKFLKDNNTWETVSGSGSPSSTVTNETTFGISPLAGSSSEYSRGDHTHGTPANPITSHESTYDHTDYNTAYSHSQSTHAPSNAQKNSDILKSEIEAVLTGEISSHTHAGGGGLSHVQIMSRISLSI